LDTHRPNLEVGSSIGFLISGWLSRLLLIGNYGGRWLISINMHLFYFHCLVILCLISKFWKSGIAQFKIIFLKSLCIIFIIYRLLGRRPHVGLHGFCFVALTFLPQYKMSSFNINIWLMLVYFLGFTDCLQKNQPIG
jgi:hypothetical protein